MAFAIRGNAFRYRRALAPLEIDDGEAAAGFQRIEQALVEGLNGGDVVIDVAKEDRIAARLRQVRLSQFALNDRDLRQVVFLHHGLELGHILLAEIGPVDAPARTDLRGHDSRQPPLPGPDVRHRLTLTNVERLDQLRQIR